MKTYKIYAKKIQNNPAKEVSYVQSIMAKNKQQAIHIIRNMPDHSGFYFLNSFFAVIDR